MTAGARPRRITLVGFGEVGQTLGADLAGTDLQVHAWDRLFAQGGSAPTRARAALPHVQAAQSMAQAAGRADLVICAVTAGECVAAAREAAPALAAGTWWFDLNSVSPGTKAQAAAIIHAAGGRFVEAAVMSPIAPRRSASPMLLAGPHAQAFEPIAGGLGFTGARAFSPAFGAACAAKMCRSVMVKGMEALLAEALLAARHYGVEDTVLGSLADLFPGADWPRLAQYMISRSLQHGVRRAEEMREVARTVAESGVEPWMSRACVERQQWAASRAAALRSGELGAMLDSMRTMPA